MKIERIRNRIEGLKGLLTQAIRIGEPQYIRSIRGDIERLEREYRIEKVKENNKDSL
jgi:hypothetical protein